MGNLVTAMGIFTIWGIVDYFNIRGLFYNFFATDERGKGSSRYVWLLYYFAVTYAYCISKYTKILILYAIFYVLFYFRAVPFLWSEYGKKIKIPVIVFFYEEIESFISINISLLLTNLVDGIGDFYLIDDLCTAIVAVLFFIILLMALHFRRGGQLKLWFANLSVKKYLLLIVTIFLLGNLETVICNSSACDSFMKGLTVVTALLTGVVVCQVIVINERVYTRQEIIGILEEEMKKLTGYYNELNDKDTQLRRFRHDTKNLLLALHSMVADGKNEQALEYMEKMEGMYQKTARQYDTGNFIADALLTARAHEAERIHTRITAKGFFPSERVEDVDMVILLSNILDNALDACGKIEGEKEIVLDSVLEKYVWVLTAKNPVEKNVVIRKNQIPTSKENPDVHGYGLLNMKKVAGSYNGAVKLACENNEFVVRVTLQLAAFW